MKSRVRRMSKPVAREMAKNSRRNGNEHHQSAKEGVTSLDEWQRRVGHALRNLGDRIVLNWSPLARLAYVERVARERYNDHLLPRGLALREVLIFCVEVIGRDLANEPAMSRACKYLVLLKEGLSCQQISKELGLSREHVSRVYRRKAFELLTEQFLCVIKRGEPKQ